MHSGRWDQYLQLAPPHSNEHADFKSQLRTFGTWWWGERKAHATWMAGLIGAFGSSAPTEVPQDPEDPKSDVSGVRDCFLC